MSGPSSGIAPLDPFHLIPDIISGNVRVIRQSNMGTADVCLKRLGYELDPNIPGGTGEARIVGTAYHSGMEALYAARMNGERLPLEQVRQAGEVSFWKQVDEAGGAGALEWDKDAVAAAFKVTSMLTAYDASGCAWGDEWNVLGVEAEWFAPLDEKWATKGTIDLVLQHRDTGEVVLCDHKTSGRKWQKDKEHARKNQQVVLYAWAWWRVTGQMVERFFFDVMTYKGEFDRKESRPRPEHMAAVLEKAHQLATLIEVVGIENLPANTSSNLCSSRFCDFWLRCPMGQVAL